MKFKVGNRYFELPTSPVRKQINDVLGILGRSSNILTSSTVSGIISDCMITGKKLPEWICENYKLHFDCGTVIGVVEDGKGKRWVKFKDDKHGMMKIEFYYFMSYYKKEENNNPYKK